MTSTRAPLARGLRELIDEAPSHLVIPPGATYDEIRAEAVGFYDWLRGPVDPDLAHVATADARIGGVPVRWYNGGPAEDDDVIVFIHGGGWNNGSVHTHDADARELARTVGSVVVSVDYRLAPEHPFPAPLEDCLAVVTAVAGRPHRSLSLVGDSAGGNLVLAVASEVRKDIELAAVLALYPCIDPDALENISYSENGDDYLLTREGMRINWELYLANDADRADPRANLRDLDLRGFPSTVIATADYDPLRDEDQSFAARLIEADNEVTYLSNPGLIHGFQQMTHRVPMARCALMNAYDAFSATVQRSVSRRAANEAGTSLVR